MMSCAFTVQSCNSKKRTERIWFLPFFPSSNHTMKRRSTLQAIYSHSHEHQNFCFNINQSGMCALCEQNESFEHKQWTNLKLLSTLGSSFKKRGVDCFEQNFNYLQNIGCVYVCVSLSLLSVWFLVSHFLFHSFSFRLTISDDEIDHAVTNGDAAATSRKKFSHELTWQDCCCYV